MSRKLLTVSNEKLVQFTKQNDDLNDKILLVENSI